MASRATIKGWKGVAWPRVVRGVCTRHKTPVGRFTGICHTCHKEQLAAAQAGSNAWERS